MLRVFNCIKTQKHPANNKVE